MTEWEQALLDLENEPENEELIHQMFRAIHTLKGSAGFIGFGKLQKVCHDLESALQEIRDGTARLDSETIDLLFSGLDLCTRMVSAFASGEQFDEDIGEFLGQLWEQSPQSKLVEKALSGGSSSEDHAGGEGEQPADSSPESSVPQKRFQLKLHIQASGREAYLRAFLIRNRLSAIGTVICEDPPPEILRESGGRFEYTVLVETTNNETAVREALNVDQLEIMGFVEYDGRAAPGETAQHAEGSDGQAPTARVEEVVRVSVERLDTLLNLVGELVIQNSGFITIAGELKSQYGKTPQILDLEAKTELLSKITRDLQDGIMKVRMLPVSTVFNRFYRVVRDLAKDRRKEITLQVYGEETEIDKKVMDRIGDPLVHLIRNAADHGIESREERLAAGKAPVGLIRLGAYQEGDHICIEVSDDGRGLDKNGVLRKAVETRLVRPEEAQGLSDEQILSLIFLPGFSTAREVSQVSGRGVGMDVVKRAIEGMDGSIRIRSSAGRGTSVTISLPLTMAIIPAVLVGVSGSTLAIPLSAVKEVLKLGEAELRSVGTRPAIRLRDEVLAVVYLREALQLDGNGGGSPEDRLPIVIVDYEEKKIGLEVDRVLGTGEIVIKSLSRHYREIDGLIGASILGNGRIALIVDVEAMVRQYYHSDSLEHSFTDSSIFSFQDRRPGGPKARVPATVGPEPEAAIEADGADAAADRPCDEATSDPAAEANVPAASEEDPLADPVAELNSGRGALLEEINNEGAVQASMALSRLTSREIRVSFPESQIIKLGEIPDLLGGPEAPVGGIYVGIEGDLEGGIMMVLPATGMLAFHDQMYGHPQGTCQCIEQVDMSAISELGNILAASFINAISNGTKLTVKSDSPEISVDMCEPVIDSVLARFSQPGERILFTKALIYSEGSDEVACHLLMFLVPESMRALSEVLLDGVD